MLEENILWLVSLLYLMIKKIVFHKEEKKDKFF